MKVELADSLIIDFGGEVGQEVVDLTNKTPEWLQWAMSFGLRQSVKDAMAGKAGTTDGEKALKEKFTRVCTEGLIPTKGAGGGGASLEDKIASAYLADEGHKGKLDDLDARWMDYAKATVLNSIEDATEKAEVLKNPAELAELAVEYLDAVKEEAAASEEWAKIKAKLTAPKAKKAAKPKLKIVIGGKK